MLAARPPHSTALLALAGLAIAMAPNRSEASIANSDCLACHGDKDFSRTGAGGKTESLFVDEARFAGSIHAGQLCTSCHQGVREIPHPEHLKPVSCGQCHRIETEIYLASDHGQAIHRGVPEAASCRDCHGDPHGMLNSRDPESPVNRAHIPQTCGRCHAKGGEADKHDLRQRAVVMSYERSVHGLALARGVANTAVCSDCHGTHDLHRSTNPLSKLYWQNIPATCGKCHENVRQTYARSVHGKAVAAGLRDAPVCTDCHGEHTIEAVKAASSKVSPSHIPETCGQCHGAERIASRYELSPRVVETYRQSFHGLGLQFGGISVANCASCHGFHDILPPSDPRSSVNPANLPQTCGKCHPDIGTRLARGEMHIHGPPGAGKGRAWIVRLVTTAYVVLIVLVVGGMFLHNALDYLRKARLHVRRARQQDGEQRLTRWMRVQHFINLVLFFTLAYTGFVHRFPDAFWSWPFRAMESGGAIRGLIHRVAGWLFIALFLGHLVGLLATARGREHLRRLWPRLHDLTDAAAMVAFNLGLRSSPPPHRRWTYIEKSEYWALLWGSVIMIVTGIMLLFTEAALRLWPEVWHDVAQVMHYYEAVLATLAIVVWHFYWTILDPREYPMNPAWLIGKKAPEPAEAALEASATGEPTAAGPAGSSTDDGGAPKPTA
jgi:cytochrome b subunit of formate dehydrogenase